MKPSLFYLLTLGCPKNRIDGEVMAAALTDRGHRQVDNPSEAELLLVNTCAFIQAAQEEAIDAILEAAALKKHNPSCRLIVTGCLPQRFGPQLRNALPEVDLFLGMNDVPHVARAVESLLSGNLKGTSPRIRRPAFLMTAAHRRRLSTPSHTAYLKIAEGCSHRCSYCVIPRIRGRARSRSIEDLVKEAEILAGQGVRELILVAQDTTAYGMDRGDKNGLGALLRALAAVEGIAWIRLLYGHPDHLTPDILRQLAGGGKICAYLDLPIQHIHDTVLAAMNRSGRRQQIERVIALARSLAPGIALRTSLIVGFPGETEKRFATLLAFVREARFDHLGVFTYSREEGTAAARYRSRISEQEKNRRRETILEEQSLISFALLQQRIGTDLDVLVEGKTDRPDYPYWGRNRRQAPEIDGITYVRCSTNLNPGQILTCRVTATSEYDLFTEARVTGKV